MPQQPSWAGRCQAHEGAVGASELVTTATISKGSLKLARLPSGEARDRLRALDEIATVFCRRTFVVGARGASPIAPRAELTYRGDEGAGNA